MAGPILIALFEELEPGVCPRATTQPLQTAKRIAGERGGLCSATHWEPGRVPQEWECAQGIAGRRRCITVNRAMCSIGTPGQRYLIAITRGHWCLPRLMPQ